MRIRPISLREANAFVEKNHRHNGPVRGQRFSLSLSDDRNVIRGVAICGNPLARALDDGETLEIRRVCTDGTRNACSMLYGACVRAARALGYRRVITYTLQSEPGCSLRASNFTLADNDCGGRSWDTPSRPREDTQLTMFGEKRKYPDERKMRWEIVFNER